jgi:hypothetical protein
MLTELTAQDEARIIEVRDKYLAKLFNYVLLEKFDAEKMKAAVNDLYAFANLPLPKDIIIADSPKAAQKICNDYNRTYNNDPSLPDQTWEFAITGDVSDYNWLSFYEFFMPMEGILTDEAKTNLQRIIDIVDTGIFTSIQLEVLCIPVKMPNFISRDAENNLHCTSGPAITFVDGYGQYYIHGRFLEQSWFDKTINKTLTREEYLAISNEDIKGCINTIMDAEFGPQYLAEFLGATEISRVTITHPTHTEELVLFRTKEKFSFARDSKGNENASLAWIQMTCPSTQNIYMISTCPTFEDALECAKFHRYEGIPKDIPYIWQSAS